MFYSADDFRLLACSGALFCPGQVVRAELGFRIVKDGDLYEMRTDLLGLSIINDDITQVKEKEH